MRVLSLALVAVGLLMVLAPNAFALFTNGGFETGDFAGWTKATFLNPGLLGSSPFTGADIVRNTGGSDLTQVRGPFATGSQTDPNTGGVLHYPLSGNYCAVINFQGASRNGNSLSQQDTTVPGDVAPDGKIHVQFAWAGVVQNPSHADTQQPFIYVALRNVTKGTLLYETFNFAGTSAIWHNAAATVQYTDWQVIDMAPDPSALAAGDTVQIEAIAAGCSLGGHWGYLYVDHFGAFIPVTPHITAADKIYDGTTDATITSRTLSGVQPGDDVSLVGGTATFGSATPGAGKTVTATGLSLTGSDVDKYMLTSFTATTTADIFTLPTVTTTAPSAVTATAATGGGDVTSDGFAAVTARGVCWSTSADPTLADSHTTDGTGTGTFTSSITGLSENTTYHVRAYATNSAGTSYGADLTFTTTFTVSFVTDGTPGASLTGDVTQSVPLGGSTTGVTADPPIGYHFVDWTFDGSTSTDNPLTLTSIDGSITATAHFAIDTNVITASAGPHGVISPSGAVSVDYGADQTFAITPAPHYRVAHVFVDGVSVGAVTSYTFNDVTAAHTITASFARTHPPTTKVKGLPSRWVNHSVKLTLVATRSPGGAPVAYTEYRIGSGPWIRGTTVIIKSQGTTIITYRSVDTDGNVEAAKTCRVRIDLTPPKVYGGSEVNVFWAHTARFTYRLSDNLAKMLRCRLVITWHGKVVVVKQLGLHPVHRRLVATLRCTMRATGGDQYIWRIVAFDAAGNRTAGIGHELEVVPPHHG